MQNTLADSTRSELRSRATAWQRSQHCERDRVTADSGATDVEGSCLRFCDRDHIRQKLGVYGQPKLPLGTISPGQVGHTAADSPRPQFQHTQEPNPCQHGVIKKRSRAEHKVQMPHSASAGWLFQSASGEHAYSALKKRGQDIQPDVICSTARRPSGIRRFGVQSRKCRVVGIGLSKKWTPACWTAKGAIEVTRTRFDLDAATNLFSCNYTAAYSRECPFETI